MTNTVKEITIAQIPDHHDDKICISAKIINKAGSTIIVGDSTTAACITADEDYFQRMDVGKWYRITVYVEMIPCVAQTPTPIDVPVDVPARGEAEFGVWED